MPLVLFVVLTRPEGLNMIVFPRNSAVVLLLLFLFQFTLSIDLRTDIEPTGPLKIRLDYALATKRDKSDVQERHEYVFTSHLSFKGLVNSNGGITDGQLVQMTIDAHKEMPPNFKMYKPKESNFEYPGGVPTVMTALAFGSEVIFASSQKGDLQFISSVGTSKVWKQLNECKVLWGEATDRDEEHKHDRHCGEIMALQQYNALYGNRDISSFDGQARMVSIRVRKIQGGKPLGWETHDPCGEDDPVSFQPDRYERSIPTSLSLL